MSSGRGRDKGRRSCHQHALRAGAVTVQVPLVPMVKVVVLSLLEATRGVLLSTRGAGAGTGAPTRSIHVVITFMVGGALAALSPSAPPPDTDTDTGPDAVA